MNAPGNRGAAPHKNSVGSERAAAQSRPAGKKPGTSSAAEPGHLQGGKPGVRGVLAAVLLSAAGVILILIAELTREVRFTLSAGFCCVAVAQLLPGSSLAVSSRKRRFRVVIAAIVLALAFLNLWQPWTHG